MNKLLTISLVLASFMLVASCSQTADSDHAQPESAATTSPTLPADSAATGAVAAAYTCPMHPEVASTTPGPCPKCGMDLEKK